MIRSIRSYLIDITIRAASHLSALGQITGGREVRTLRLRRSRVSSFSMCVFNIFLQLDVKTCNHWQCEVAGKKLEHRKSVSNSSWIKIKRVLTIILKGHLTEMSAQLSYQKKSWYLLRMRMWWRLEKTFELDREFYILGHRRGSRVLGRTWRIHFPSPNFLFKSYLMINDNTIW